MKPEWKPFGHALDPNPLYSRWISYWDNCEFFISVKQLENGQWRARVNDTHFGERFDTPEGAAEFAEEKARDFAKSILAELGFSKESVEATNKLREAIKCPIDFK